MSPLNYKSAGVNIQAGDAFVRNIRKMVKTTHRSEVIGDIGGFGGYFRPHLNKFKDPILVSGTDGVGTKLDIAHSMGVHDTIGLDLVAMCVNDIIVSGAEPLFFLDYLATGKLNSRISTAVLKGITKGCKQAGCALIGGETAEMPSFYSGGRYDLAGFVVGVVDRPRMITGKNIKKKRCPYRPSIQRTSQ